MKWVVRSNGETRHVEVERVLGGFEVLMGDERRRVEVIRLDETAASLRYVDDGKSFAVSFHRGQGRQWRIGVCSRDFEVETLTPVEAIEASAGTDVAGPSTLGAPIPGKVVAVHVAVGDHVEAGQPLVVLEAMKMENELAADRGGAVIAVHVEPGRTVNAGEVLIELE
jgi:biotin carboxyl carrier protein